MNVELKNDQQLAAGFRSTLPIFGSAVFFSLFINLLMFVSPLYMLQIYDRVITSRSEPTLWALTTLAAILIGVYAALEMLRSRLLVRAGILFDQRIAEPVFNAVHRANLMKPGGGHVQCLRDMDTLREFLTGSGLLALCDAPWFPIFVFACFLLHPWFGYMALGGSAVTLCLTFLNETVTKGRLNAAGRASIAANQSAQAMFRNTDVLQAMGMLGAIKKLWAVHHDDTLGLQASASDRAGAIVASTKFFRVFMQTAVLGIRRLPRHPTRAVSGRHDRRLHLDRPGDAADRARGDELEGLCRRAHRLRAAAGPVRDRRRRA